MSRLDEMNNFLTYYAKVYEQNPNFQISHDTLYDGLKKYGMNNNEFSYISNHFQEWIQRFSNSQNINVYHTEKQKAFLQFAGKNKPRGGDCYKLYVSYNAEDIYECANKIFEFIDKENIQTASKIAQETRSDAIVLRIYNPNDVAKVINFINSDQELYSKAKPTNPFITKHGAVAMAYDNMLSYNSTLSLLMEKYYEKCRVNNNFKNVSVEDFKTFIRTFQRDNLREINGIKNWQSSDEYKENQSRFNSFGDYLENLDEVIELIARELDENFKFIDYMSTVQGFQNQEKRVQMSNYYNQAANYNVQDSYKIFIGAIEETIKKANYTPVQVETIINYCIQGDYRYITNGTGNYRDIMSQTFSPDQFIELCSTYLKHQGKEVNPGTVIHDFAETLYKQLELEKTEDMTPVTEQIQNNDFNNKYNLVIEALKATITKYNYGPENITNITRKCLSGDYSNITNGNNNYREQMKQTITPSDIEVICKNHLELSGHDLSKVGDLATYFAYVISDQVKELTTGQAGEGQR